MSKFFWNIIARRYAKSAIANEDIYNIKINKTREYMRDDMRVLEFGCGTGSTALLHAPFVNDYLGIDSSEKMIEICHEKLRHTDIFNLTFQIQSFDDFTSPPESFDLILGLNILHLMQKPNNVLSKVNQLLKPGGLFIQSTPCVLDSTPWLRFILPPLSWSGLLPSLSYMSERDLIMLLEDAGFKNLYQLAKETPSQAEFIVSEKQ